jgi:arylsulfatase A-like enzyme/tetratricopeptide (TPR) repeat protein
MLKKVFGLAGVVIVAAAAWWFMRAPAFTIVPNADRNVLLVTIDTLRADALGSYGGRATTTNLDRLAARGARFDFAHAHAVITLGSHASILSGTYPYEHGIRDNTGYRFPQAMPTAATLLKSQGFATGAFVGGFPLDHRFGLNVGFDVYDDNLAPAPGAESAERERRADVVVTSALDWIGQQQNKWFTWVHVYDPHVTYAAPPEWAAKFPSDPYLAEVSWTDFALGALFDRLSALPRRTLVIVTADHGESLGEHGELTHSLFAYEATLHVPLIIAELGGAQTSTPTGVTVSSPVRHVDILPTILDSAAAPALATAAGSSLRPLIDSGGGADRPSYFESMSANIARGWAPLRGVLVGRDKFIDLPIAELYDLQTDPKELRNVLSTEAERASVLSATLKGFNVAPPGKPKAETADTIEALRSLGYIGGGGVTVKEKYTEADDPKKLVALEQAMTSAMTAFREGKASEAIGIYQDVIAKRPDMEDAYRKLAFVYWRTGRPADAISALETALRAGVTQSEVKIKLGEYLAQSGQPAKAIQLLSSFAADDPDALIALGNAYQMSGRSADAIRTFQHLVAVDPKSGVGYQNIGITRLQSKDFADAERYLRQALAVDANLPDAYNALGALFAQTKRPADAIDAWKRATAIDSTQFDALYNLIGALAQSGRMDEARVYGDRFITTAPPSLQSDVAAVRKLLGR